MRPPTSSGSPALAFAQIGFAAGVFIITLIVVSLIYVASARGTQADWFRNILVNPRVHVRVKSRQFQGVAEPITDLMQIADFIELRLRRHPRMIGAILKSEGLLAAPSRAQLEDYARNLAMVIIRPV